MSRVIYLLGAGASYGKRNESEPKDSPSRIVEGLPVVNEINDEIEVVIKWIKDVEIKQERLYPSFNGYTSEKMKDVLIEGLEWLKEKSSQHATIDTFAKKLYLNCETKSDYGRLKLLLSSFFMIEQHIHPFDKRYDTFIANILNDDTAMPKDMYILTWNYDCQLDIAYRDYNRWGLEICVPVEQTSEANKSVVYKINGSANFYGVNQVDTERIASDNSESLLDLIFHQFCVTCERGGYSSGTTELFFAWEKDTFDSKSSFLYKKIADAEILVVIGYTFPFFNRKIDREIFAKMPHLKKIYIQDPRSKDVKEFLYSVLTEEQRNTLYPNVVTVNNVTNFFLPPEL